MHVDFFNKYVLKYFMISGWLNPGMKNHVDDNDKVIKI